MMVELANPDHALPYPGAPGRIVTGSEPFEIAEHLPFWNACLRDGSIVEVQPPAPSPRSVPAISSAKE